MLTRRPILSKIPAICSCGWQGKASEAICHIAGLVQCPRCKRPVERRYRIESGRLKPTYQTKG